MKRDPCLPAVYSRLRVLVRDQRGDEGIDKVTLLALLTIPILLLLLIFGGRAEETLEEAAAPLTPLEGSVRMRSLPKKAHWSKKKTPPDDPEPEKTPEESLHDDMVWIGAALAEWHQTFASDREAFQARMSEYNAAMAAGTWPYAQYSPVYLSRYRAYWMMKTWAGPTVTYELSQGPCPSFSLPADTWGRPFRWTGAGGAPTYPFKVTSAGPDGKFGSADDIVVIAPK